MSDLGTPALLAIFVGAALATWVAGVNLAKATDLLDDRYGLGEALGGMIRPAGDQHRHHRGSPGPLHRGVRGHVRRQRLPAHPVLAADLVAGQPVLPAEGKANAWIGCVGLLMTAVFVTGIVLRPQRRHHGLDSWIALLIYALVIWGLVVVSS